MRGKTLALAAALLLSCVAFGPNRAEAAPFVVLDAFGRPVILDDGLPSCGGFVGSSGFSNLSLGRRGISATGFGGIPVGAGRIEATQIRGPFGRLRFQQFRSGF